VGRLFSPHLGRADDANCSIECSPIGQRARRPLLSLVERNPPGHFSGCTFQKKSGCPSDIGRLPTDRSHTRMWIRPYLPLEGLLTRGSGELEHTVLIEDHMLFSRYFSTGLDEYKASPIVPTRVMGCTGCTVPINLRATLRCTAALGITPAGCSP
jgi:hypothetical protein